jgi:hypothetical protein
MYHESIVERNLERVQAALGLRLQRYDDSAVDEMTEHLKKLVKTYDKNGMPKEWVREPTTQEWSYINNERIISKYDFSYFSNRYAMIRIVRPDGSPVAVDRLGKYGLMKTQEALMMRIKKDELAMYDAYDRGQSILGLLYFVHKARQTGFTALTRMMEKQRTFFWPDTMALAASENLEMVQELYRRDKVLYDNMPWFIRPAIRYDTKDEQLEFDGINTVTLYHQGNQRGGLGTGKTISVAHLTECALWDRSAANHYDNTRKILDDLYPAIPRSLNTLYIMESTAMGIGGFWYDQVELIRSGSSRFKLFFCPWYAADEKYAETPPFGWEPNDFVKHQAEVAEQTSYEYLGYKVKLTVPQLYWYEKTMDEHTGRLFTFFSNYPTTIEESFQNSGDCAFSYELLRDLGMGVGAFHGAYDMSVGY